MRAVVQRVKRASLYIDERKHASIAGGMLVLLGVETGDSEADADWLAQKTVNLRIFDDAEGVMNRSVLDVDGEVMAVSQFTLLASYKKGNRPSYIRAARHETAIPLYEYFCEKIEEQISKRVKTGVFGANMQIELVNDGPVTICMDTKHKE